MKKIKNYIKSKFPRLYTLLGKTKALHVSRLIEEQKKNLPVILKNYFKGTKDSEILQILAFLENNPLQMFPYEFTKKYSSESMKVFENHVSGYPYAMIQNSKVFFPKSFSPEDIKVAVKEAILEQDVESPHRYLNGTVNLQGDDVAALAGASDGAFCLDIIEKVKKVYLFEPDPMWHEPLNLTLDKWRGKFEIVPKFVSDSNDNQSVTLDSFFARERDYPTFIQADIEGCETRLLTGAKKLLEAGRRMRFSICSYHQPEDFEEISEILARNGFHVQPSRGYMLMWMQAPLPKPYLRRGVVYAWR